MKEGELYELDDTSDGICCTSETKQEELHLATSRKGNRGLSGDIERASKLCQVNFCSNFDIYQVVSCYGTFLEHPAYLVL